MKLIIMVACATVFLYACNSAKQIALPINGNQLDQSGKPMLLGKSNRGELEKDSFAIWFNKNYNEYTVKDSALQVLKKEMQGKSIKIFMGTWCGDSRREVPRMMKLLDSASVPASALQFIMLDDRDSAYKQSPTHEEKGLNIHRVPTFIVYEGKEELGRIVESPAVSLEADLLSIITAQPYYPRYRAVVYLDSVFRINRSPKIERKINAHQQSVRLLVRNAGELNTYGYVLMAAKKLKESEIVFKMNAELYPAKANVFDSLAEFYFKTGKLSLSEENYRKVLKLDPGNKNAMLMLEKINRTVSSTN